MTSQDGLTHLDDSGAARMVDVAAKDVSVRTATATGRVDLSAECVALLRGEGVPKGDALAVARIAGIMAAKRTPDLVPLCHPIALTSVEAELRPGRDGVEVRVEVKTVDRTGVEMEALTGASAAALTIYDMLKSVDRGMVVERLQLEHKSGGRSGTWSRPAGRSR
jgi:cyclic pyranopterin monophosphate synthase